jgi:hypothetical protein
MSPPMPAFRPNAKPRSNRVLSSSQIITEALHKAHAGELVQDDSHERTRQLQRARQKVERQIERLVEAFTAEVLTLEELKARRAGLQERLRLLTQQERELQLQHQQQVRLAELSANVGDSVRPSAQGCRHSTLRVVAKLLSCSWTE